MTNLNNAAEAAEKDQLSDGYVNAVIREHGYGHPAAVAARLWQWIGLHGGENGVSLLIYEAHKALSKLRAEGVQAGDERAAVHNAAIKAAAKVCADIARQYDPQNNQENALASELYSAGAAILKLVKEDRAALASANVVDERVSDDTLWSWAEQVMGGKEAHHVGRDRVLRYAHMLLASAPVHRPAPMEVSPGHRAALADIRDELNRLGMFAHTALSLDADDMRNNMDDLAERLLALAGSAPVASAHVAGEAQPVAYAVHGIDARGRIRVAAVKPWAGDESLCDSDGLGDMWSGNEPLVYANAAPQASEAVRNKRLKRANTLPEVECPRCELKVISSCGSKGCRTNDGYADLWQTQADKDGGDWEPQTPQQIAANMRNFARTSGFDWPEPDCAKGAGDAKAWVDLFWSVAKELNCLPSSFVDGNEHVLRAARVARAALAAQPAAQMQGDSDA